MAYETNHTPNHCKLNYVIIIRSADFAVTSELVPESFPTSTMLSRRLVLQLRQSHRLLARANSSIASSTAAAPSKTSPQAPNYPSTWSTSQSPRPAGSSGPRFEQTAMEVQPNPLSAMELIANEPIRLVHGRKAVCDGGE